MPLDPLQEHIARTALSLPQAHTLALAGGGAMIAHGFTDRATRDVDLFTEVDPDEAGRIVVALRSRLQDEGLQVIEASRRPHTNRFVVTDPASGSACLVEVFPDGGRLRPTVRLDIGPVLHPDDLAADKTLALWGRAEIRDYVDVVALLDRYPPDTLLRLAAAKDAGFTGASFADALRAIRRFDPEDWTAAGVHADAVARIQELAARWSEELRTG
ncbi:MAG TPA: nucleotidyl transferase AbiEii/AbiGii toxin family protein [Mycobacteriales bacterium]|nr:nucleotidyl transferase AbiEii/AbiGii toxin family protein [Mycobacteriales bacterium]